jgi:histidinol-phosphatase (PHP family)
VTGPVGEARDLPLDGHLHTDLSPDSDVPIDVYAAAAVERGVAEIAITDHVDFDPRDPAYAYATFEDRERIVRQAAARWADQGVAIRFGAELTFNTSWEADLRQHVARHRYDFTIGSVHDWPGSPYAPGRVAGWVQDRPLDEIVAPYFEQVAAAARSGLFDTIGHLDVVKRYIQPFVSPAALADRPELLEATLRALVESGTSLEMNTSGLRHPVRETYPTAETVARYRAMGGRRVTIGSDAHRAEAFAYGLEEGYRILARAEFEELTFRRDGSRITIPLPSRFAS